MDINIEFSVGVKVKVNVMFKVQCKSQLKSRSNQVKFKLNFNVRAKPRSRSKKMEVKMEVGHLNDQHQKDLVILFDLQHSNVECQMIHVKPTLLLYFITCSKADL